MTKIKAYLSNPAVWISFTVFAFSLGVTWATLNNRVSRLEEFQQTVNIVEIQTTLKEIQTDLKRIKNNLYSIN